MRRVFWISAVLLFRMNSPIQPLDTVTARRLHTGQVLVGIDAIVKELVE